MTEGYLHRIARHAGQVLVQPADLDYGLAPVRSHRDKRLIQLELKLQLCGMRGLHSHQSYGSGQI